jgi:hypothetical protein
LVISRSRPSVCLAAREARRRLPSRGACGPEVPPFAGTMRRSDCHQAHLGSLRLALASRSLACFRCVRGVPGGLGAGGKPPSHARALGHPVPLSGIYARRPMALPSSQATPMNACPALRPRGWPGGLPGRPQHCCRPATGNRRLSPHYLWRTLLLSTTLLFAGLHHAAYLLTTPGSIHPLAGMHAGSLLTCWRGCDQVGLEP